MPAENIAPTAQTAAGKSHHETGVAKRFGRLRPVPDEQEHDEGEAQGNEDERCQTDYDLGAVPTRLRFPARIIHREILQNGRRRILGHARRREKAKPTRLRPRSARISSEQ